jgi:hypothetical protein
MNTPLTDDHKAEIIEVLQRAMDRPPCPIMGAVYGMCIAAEFYIGQTHGNESARFDCSEIHQFVRDWCHENNVFDQFTAPSITLS